MSTNVIQTSFAGGELSPTLYARVDLAKYHIGAARLLNFFVDYRGGASTRPGFEFICRTKYLNEIVRLIPFQFSTVQTYILEFGSFYMRVIKDGAPVLEAPITITGITLANPGVVTTAAPHGYVTGQQVLLLATGMTQVNDKYFLVVVTGANTFTLTDLDGNPINTSGFGAFIAGTSARVYEVAAPYDDGDLAMVKFTQSADVMTLCHPDYVPYDLSRTGDTSWTFTPINIGSSATAPGVPTILVTGAAANAFYSYKVTSVDANGQESVASPAGTAASRVNISTVPGSASITWAAVPGAVSYNVYKALIAEGNAVAPGALHGFMTSVDGGNVSAIDTNIVPDFNFGPPTNEDPFAAGNHPISVAYEQQRKVYMGSHAFPETFWMSKPGQFDNFDISDPVQPSDAITGTLVSRQVNNIKYGISMPGGLIMLTGGGAWQVSGGGQGAPLTPASIQATPQAYNGCADVEPLTINYDILYVQQKGTVVRDLSYSFYTNIYTGADLSVLSNHLFTGYSIVQWTYAEEPFKVIWAVRSDGALLSLTYLKEQEVFGWAKHETQGRFKSIASIQEGQENAVYAVVQRFIGGRQIQFIERMHTRFMPYGAEDAFFLDSGLSNTLTYPVASLQINAPTGTGVTFSTSAPIFVPGNVGDVIRAGGGIATITSYIDNQHVFATITRPITDLNDFHDPVEVWEQAAGTWSLDTPVTQISGLDHLEGQTVQILGDGNLFPPQVVSNGGVVLSQPCTKVHIGLGYTAQLQTLYLDVGEPTVQGKRKNIPAMTMRVDQTRGLAAGPTFEDLTSYKDRVLSTIGQPIELFTGDQRLIIGGGWTTQGQVCIEQSNPLPATILGVIPEIQIGDTGK